VDEQDAAEPGRRFPYLVERGVGKLTAVYAGRDADVAGVYATATPSLSGQLPKSYEQAPDLQNPEFEYQP
jgi:hypothetical protein